MFYRIIFAFFIGLVCFFANAQQKEQRVALVIGNSSYKSSPLKNPVNDARDMAISLRGYGFTVIERTNLTTRQVGSTLREFRSKLTPGSVAVVFYAGHGVQIKGENYLPTVDAEINGEEDVPMQSLSTRQVMDILGEAKTRMNLVFLDACRDNPYARSFRSGSRGIAKENAPSGTLISFATRPGSVAGDGDGRNGLYTSVLLEKIKQSNQPIEQVLKRVVSGVKVASKGLQEPWMEGSIEGDFCFGQCGGSLQPTNATPVFSDPELDAWEIAKLNNTLIGYQTYLKNFPKGRFASSAMVAVASLSSVRTEILRPEVGVSQSSYQPSEQNSKVEFGGVWFIEASGGYVYVDSKNYDQSKYKSTLRTGDKLVRCPGYEYEFITKVKDINKCEQNKDKKPQGSNKYLYTMKVVREGQEIFASIYTID